MSEVKVRVRQQRKPSRIAQERKQDLIEAAIRNIADHGYDAVTVATICEEAGFSRGLIGHYFSGKDELLLEAVQEVDIRRRKALPTSVRDPGGDTYATLYSM